MKQARLLKKDEFKRVLAIIGAHKHSERNRIIFYLSFYAGLRACEIASLRISDVVDGNNTVKAEVVLEANMTKGSERQRVMLSTTLQKHLQRFISAHSASTTLDKPLLRSQKGGAFTALTITQLFAKFYDWAVITGASSHSGRRQFITTLAEKQINVRVIQALARHKHLNTTMRYIDINDLKLQNAVEAFSI
jgi:integrase/recombinase XerD